MTTTPASLVPREAEPAPDFTLPSTSGESVTLSALLGRNVLLAFFPLAFTSTCTAELCAVRDDYDQFQRREVVVHPISVDSIPTLKEYKSQHRMQADLLSDFRRDVSRLYGTLLEDKFFSNRAYFLIDRRGIVRWAHVEDHPGQRRDNAEILAEINRLV